MFGGLFGLFLSSMETSPTIVAQQANAANAAAAQLKGVPATPTAQIIENPSVKVRGSKLTLPSSFVPCACARARARTTRTTQPHSIGR